MSQTITLKAGQFRGRLAGRDYTDPALFEQAAEGYIHRVRLVTRRPIRPIGGSARNTTRLYAPKGWALGAEISFQYRDTVVSGQVWSAAPRGAYWVRGDDGHTYQIRANRGYASSHIVTRHNTLGQPLRDAS